MKSLRILVGRHAGAQLALTGQPQRIANDEEADIQITDWQHAAVVIQSTPSGEVSLSMHAEVPNTSHAAALALPTLVDFVPQRFGDVVMCVGPTVGPWPSDMSMLAQLMQAPAATAAAAAARRAVRRLLAAGGVLAAAAVSIGGVVASGSRPAILDAVPVPLSLRDRIEQALAKAGIADLAVREIDGAVIVRGLLADNAEVLRVRALLARFEGAAITHRYGIAADVGRAIADAVADAGVRAEYRGHGVFEIAGHTRDLPRLRDTLERVRADLGEQLVRIDVVATEDPSPRNVKTGAAMSAGGIEYVEGANGTRYFSIVTDPGAALAAPTPLPPDADHSRRTR